MYRMVPMHRLMRCKEQSLFDSASLGDVRQQHSDTECNTERGKRMLLHKVAY
jgi:hypothetical protein